MIDALQVVTLGMSLLLLALVLELVRRKQLTEEYSFVWIVCAVIMIGLSMARRMVDAAAVALGIAYGPAILLLVLVFFVFIASLSFSVVVSRQRRQIERLIEDAALVEAQVRELRASSGLASSRGN